MKTLTIRVPPGGVCHVSRVKFANTTIVNEGGDVKIERCYFRRSEHATPVGKIRDKRGAKAIITSCVIDFQGDA